MTGMPTVETAVQALECGAYRYLLKPVDPDVLLQAVAQAVEVRHSVRALLPDTRPGLITRRAHAFAPSSPAASIPRSTTSGWRSSRSSAGARSASTRTRRWCAPTSRASRAPTTSSTPPSSSHRVQELGRTIRRSVAERCRERTGRRAHLREPARERSHRRRALRARRPARGVRRAHRLRDHRARRRSTR